MSSNISRTDICKEISGENISCKNHRNNRISNRQQYNQVIVLILHCIIAVYKIWLILEDLLTRDGRRHVLFFFFFIIFVFFLIFFLFFLPLQAVKGDYVHFQWTGADTYPRNNDGEGTCGTDRSNVILQRDLRFEKVRQTDRKTD